MLRLQVLVLSVKWQQEKYSRSIKSAYSIISEANSGLRHVVSSSTLSNRKRCLDVQSS